MTSTVSAWLPVRTPVRTAAVAAGTRAGACARCGHSSGGCARCDQYHPMLGGYIDKQSYCHTFSEQPSCYTLTLGEQQ
jgi:hypothetical protein